MGSLSTPQPQPRSRRRRHFPRELKAHIVAACQVNRPKYHGGSVNIPFLVAPLIRVFRPLVFRQVFQWRQVFQ